MDSKPVKIIVHAKNTTKHMLWQGYKYNTKYFVPEEETKRGEKEHPNKHRRDSN